MSIRGPSAASPPAALLGRDDLGRLAAGMRADLVIFPRNPLEDPSLLWSGDRVVVAGGRRI